MIRVKANAKLNVFLHVTGRMSNGFHNLESLVVFVDLHDELYMEKAVDASRVDFIGDFVADINDDNTISRLLKSYENYTGHKPKVTVTVKKNIPALSGLAGGSVDAVAALKGLIKLYDVNLSYKDKIEILKHVGTDAVSCARGKPCFLNGSWDKCCNIDTFAEVPCLIVRPAIGIGTLNAYAKIKPPYTQSITYDVNQALKKSGGLIKFLTQYKVTNDFTAHAVASIPAVEQTLSFLKNLAGCSVAAMTGSGSACFALFSDKKMCDAAMIEARQFFPRDYFMHSGLVYGKYIE